MPGILVERNMKTDNIGSPPKFGQFVRSVEFVHHRAGSRTPANAYNLQA
jgi:hypothetical protein